MICFWIILTSLCLLDAGHSMIIKNNEQSQHTNNSKTSLSSLPNSSSSSSTYGGWSSSVVNANRDHGEASQINQGINFKPRQKYKQRTPQQRKLHNEALKDLYARRKSGQTILPVGRPRVPIKDPSPLTRAERRREANRRSEEKRKERLNKARKAKESFKEGEVHHQSGDIHNVYSVLQFHDGSLIHHPQHYGGKRSASDHHHHDLAKLTFDDHEETVKGLLGSHSSINENSEHDDIDWASLP